jgi:small subunit ribosomal protein S2
MTDEVDFRIPGNDDALRAIRLFAARIADAVNAGRGTRESVQADAGGQDEGGADDKRGARPPRRAVAEAATSPV